ncbi:MAG: PQQ-dependent catabolism-associated CXXCW motif protein [Gammaproteobacteria bacterium]|nr:PQQ-dependent catabolism-associated CXXCW motif protein [Gammaproteobacteria bacterium]
MCGFDRLLLGLVPAFILSVNVASADIRQPDGYRMELYNDEVPAVLDGASTVTAAEVKRLQIFFAAIVVDVQPQYRRPDELPENQIWFPIDHKGIPGAIWLPDTGYGALSGITEKYFHHHLDAATNGNKGHPVVFYCRSGCWLSWNAAKRALASGYTNVHWFHDGIDGWLYEGYKLELLTPAEGQRQAD